MAPTLKPVVKNQIKGVKKPKKKRKQQIKVIPAVKDDLPPPTRLSDELPPKKPRWTNRQRVLVFATRGITHRDRHLLEDLRGMLPHARPDSKMEKRDNLSVVNEICEMKNCNKCIFFECKKKQDLFMWVSNVPRGPSMKFLVQNIYTMGELKLTGNCLKGSRPLLSFDDNFDSAPHYKLMREVFVQTFGTPRLHPKSQPFFDHVLNFSILDNRVWFRNYQIVSEDGSLAEIGPRFVLNPVKIFEGSFGGTVLWENPHYISPNVHRMEMKKAQGNKYVNRLTAKTDYERSRPEHSYESRPLDSIFHGDALEAALALEAKQVEGAEAEIADLPDETLKKRKKKVTKKTKA